LERRRALLIAVLASAGLMVLGSIGPWVTALATSVNGIDGTNDGWIVVAAAVFAGVFVTWARDQRKAGILGLLPGLLGLGVTIYDRNNVSDAVGDNALAQALVHVGWAWGATTRSG